jgi:hypothetical protein
MEGGLIEIQLASESGRLDCPSSSHSLPAHGALHAQANAVGAFSL